MSGIDLLWFVFAALPGAFVADFLIFMVLIWWGHKRLKAKR